MRSSSRVLLGLVVALLAAWAMQEILRAAETPEKKSDSASTASAPSDIDPEAEKVLRALADSIGEAKSSRKDVTATMRLLAKAPSGRANRNVTYSIIAAQPNKLAILAKGSKDAPTVVCDGQELCVQVPEVGKFVIDKAPASFAKIVASDALEGTRASHALFAATMLDLWPADELVAKLTSARHLGEAKVGSTKCHHLQLVMDPYEFEVWIDVGDKPRLRKVVPKLDRWIEAHADELPEGAKIEMSLTFKNWATDVKLSDAQFKFSPLEGLSQVASFSGQSEKAGPEVLLNKPAPRFELDLVSGGSMSLAAHKGKDVVIVDFWATWCGPCVKSLPTVAEVASSYKSKGVVLYAVNLREGPDDILPFLQEKQLPITVAMDSSGSVAGLYKVSGIPTTVLIGKDGTVQRVHVGAGDGLKEQLSRELDALVAGKLLAQQAE